MLNFAGNNDVYEQQARRLCKTARECNTPLEINCLGIRKQRHYPNEKFWKIAGEEQAKVVFGFDAHTVEDAYDGESLKTAKNLVNKYELNYIGKPDIVPLVK